MSWHLTWSPFLLLLPDVPGRGDWGNGGGARGRGNGQFGPADGGGVVESG